MNQYSEFVGKETLASQGMAAPGSMVNPNNGHRLTDVEIEAYNRYTVEFNSTRQRDVQEFLLDQRHRFFVTCGMTH